MNNMKITVKDGKVYDRGVLIGKVDDDGVHHIMYGTDVKYEEHPILGDGSIQPDNASMCVASHVHESGERQADLSLSFLWDGNRKAVSFYMTPEQAQGVYESLGRMIAHANTPYTGYVTGRLDAKTLQALDTESGSNG